MFVSVIGWRRVCVSLSHLPFFRLVLKLIYHYTAHQTGYHRVAGHNTHTLCETCVCVLCTGAGTVSCTWCLLLFLSVLFVLNTLQSGAAG